MNIKYGFWLLVFTGIVMFLSGMLIGHFTLWQGQGIALISTGIADLFGAAMYMLGKKDKEEKNENN